MITNTNKRSVESTLTTLDEANYSFDPNNMRHIAAILREMYSDPVMAVVREYSANALDAHTLAGCSDPIEVTVPTRSEPVLKIRDFGNGLSDDEVKRLLLGYGASGDHKRSSNQYVGGFGIGAKSAFAVADQFTFVTHHEGKCATWHAFRDQDDDCKATKISENPSDSPSGVAVIIPIASDQVFAVQQAIAAAFRFYDVKPKLINAGPDLLSVYNKPFPATSFSGTLSVSDKDGNVSQVAWKILSEYDNFFQALKDNNRFGFNYRRQNYEHNSYVVMGQVGYPIDWSKLDCPEIRGLVLTAPVGSIQLAPSRETLSYTGRVKETLKGVVDMLVKQVEQDVLAKLKKTTCAYQMFQLLTTAEQSLPSDVKKTLNGPAIKQLMLDRGLDYSGYHLKRKAFERVILSRMDTGWARRSGTYKTIVATSPFSDPDVASTSIGRFAKMVILTYADGDKIPYQNIEVIRKVGSALYPGGCDQNGVSVFDLGIPSIWVLISHENSLNSVTTPAWAKDGSISAVLKMSELPEIEDVWIKYTTRPTGSRSSSGVSNRQSYSQHSKKFAKLKSVLPSYGGTKSENWVAVSAADLKDKDSLLYVVHDRFVPNSLDGRPCYDVFRDFENLKSLKGFDDMGDGLYGIRSRDHKWAKEQESLVHIQDYFRGALDKVCSGYGLTREQVECGFWVYDMVYRGGYTAGMFVFLFGSVAHRHPDTELHKLLSPFLSSNTDDLFTFFYPTLYTCMGRKVVYEWFGDKPFEYVSDSRITLNKNNAKPHTLCMWEVIKKAQATTVRENLVESLRTDVWRSNASSMEQMFPKEKAIKYYQLLLEMEKLSI